MTLLQKRLEEVLSDHVALANFQSVAERLHGIFEALLIEESLLPADERNDAAAAYAVCVQFTNQILDSRSVPHELNSGPRGLPSSRYKEPEQTTNNHD